MYNQSFHQTCRGEPRLSGEFKRQELMVFLAITAFGLTEVIAGSQPAIQQSHQWWITYDVPQEFFDETIT